MIDPLARRQLAAQILLDEIDERSATILKLRYGLEGEDPMTLKEIGQRIGLTRERVRQIETTALERLAREREIAALAPA